MSAKAEVVKKLLTGLETSPFELPSKLYSELDFKSIALDHERLSLHNACVCAGPEIRVGGELDLSPDILILDYGLGAIGLVHVLQQSSVSLAEQAKRHVDQATYLRHLLLTHNVTAGIPDYRLTYTVECVLAINKSLMHEMIEAVRDIATESQFLHATGLNLLPFTEEAVIDPAELRRAFAWLLPTARLLLSGCNSPGASLQGLELFNYRLPGRRPWHLAPNRVHLLHGSNGTGKSAIAEALELVVTGALERLKSNTKANYADIIRNSDSTGEPTIWLSLTDGARGPFQVNAGGISQDAMRAGLSVTAFRLDQAGMDQLIRADSQQRARVFTKAFFPGEAYDNLEQAQKEFTNAYRELPVELRQKIQSVESDVEKRHTAVISDLSWVEAPTIPAERVADCLPMKREQLEMLARIVPEIQDALQQLNAQAERVAFESTLGKLDEALGRIRSNVRRYRDAVVQSLASLQRLADWTPAPDQALSAYSDLLRDWTDHVALSDLLKKHTEISKTLLDARTEAWAPDESGAPGLLAASAEALRESIERLMTAADRCSDEQKNLFNQLQGATEAAAGGGTRRASSTLSANEIADLNLTCAWFARQEPTPATGLFGDTVQTAMSANTSGNYGTITIGAQQWTKRPAEFLAPLEPALNELLALEPATGLPSPQLEAPAETAERPVYRSPIVRLRAYQTVFAAARKVSEANQRVEETLMKRLAEHKLNEALDEVIALFTPARWAYEGLFVSTRLRDGKVAVELVTSKTNSQAETRLNTAELNLVTLALFLMCGPTIDNPLGTLILDDPLQNMDELTSATVARGVSKIAALLPAGWQLMMMFHGQEDLETFRREIPASVYHLPWLGPIGAVDGNRNEVLVDIRQNRTDAEIGSLEDVMARRPAKINQQEKSK